MQSDQLEQWLLTLPLGEPCHIDGENVYLALGEAGAELGLILLQAPNGAQIAEAMRVGFQGAREFDAGLALAPEGGDLVLNRWVPDAEAWSDVGEALEDLLNQAALWRASMAAGVVSVLRDANRREEERMRRVLDAG